MSPQRTRKLEEGASPGKPPEEAGCVGQVIGKYRVLRMLGKGGMGEVYEAEQERPIRRRVALKVIKWGMDTRDVVARFESERQALALMNHSSIARIYDAGATQGGRPYFAMELVSGVDITRYCDQRKLPVRERLALFLQVCDAVQHAHQKGIIHRDLKDSNVLVAIENGKPVPKVIDFGIAKAMAQRLTEDTVFVRDGELVGTPEYMSPEHAEMTELDLDTRADVYSLGVLLYVLLTGTFPFDSKKLREGGVAEIQRRIREAEPPKPSTRLSRLGEASSAIASSRGTDPPSLRSRLRGDLDWIVMKAMEKERTRRYASVSELAADIGRHLTHQPVLASPPSRVYRAAKFVRRHRAGVAASLLLVLTMLVAAAGTTAGLIRATRAERAATEEAQTTKQVLEFLVGLFELSDPSEAQGNMVTAREILDRGAADIRSDLADQPLVQARLLDTMGRVYSSLGLYEQARPILTEALEIRRGVLGEDHLDVAASMIGLALVLRDQADYAESRRLFERALAVRAEALGPDHPEVAAAAGSLASLLMRAGDYDEALLHFERALEIQERSLDSLNPRLADTLHNIGALYYFKGELDRAKTFWQRTLAIREEILGPNDPNLAKTLNNLSVVLKIKNDLAGAQRLLERALAIQETSLGPDHPSVAAALNNLAEVHRYMEDYPAAIPLYERAIEIQERAFGPTHPELARFVTNLGSVLGASGEDETAERYLERALEIRRDVLGADHLDVGWSLTSLADLYTDQRRYSEAEPLFREAFDIWQRALGQDSPEMRQVLERYALVLRKTGREAEARTVEDRASALGEAVGS